MLFVNYDNLDADDLDLIDDMEFDSGYQRDYPNPYDY